MEASQPPPDFPIVKYAFLLLLGFIVKLYDDLDELYLIKNGRLVECAKSFFTALTCFFLWLFALISSYSPHRRLGSGRLVASK